MESLNDLSIHLYDLMNLKKGKIKVFEDDSNKVKQEVRDGILNFGVVMLPVEEKEFDVIPFVYEELSLFVHNTHSLAQREKVEMNELKNEKFILFRQELIHNLVIQECLRAGFRPKNAFT